MKKKTNQYCWITIGIPGSGKTFWAKQQVEHDKNVVRINNDDIRDELNGGPMDHTNWTPKFEDGVRKIRTERISQALKGGYNVIVDNTHLNPKIKNALKIWLKQNFPNVEVVEKDFRDVPLQTCLDRDAERIARGERGVGPEVILKMAKESGLIPEVKPYPINWELPWAIICDLDGTLARVGKRSPYDASQCDLLDEPNLHVLNFLRTYKACYDYDDDLCYPYVSELFFFSGRTDNYREPTLRFLLEKCGFDVANDSFFELVMRQTGDSRPDEIVKKEFFDKYIKDKYNVFVIIDDRPKVVRMWFSMGLPVFNVGNGVEF